MNSYVRRRFWLEATLSFLTMALLVLTLITREWIEVLFGVDPDGGSGALELVIVLVLAVTTIMLALAARLEWRRALPGRG